MRRALLALAALSSAALLIVSAAAATTWTDPAGDANGGPDVTAVTVTNDDAGMITFDVTVALPANAAMFIAMDTNLNGKIGDSTDRVIIVAGIAPGVVVALSHGFDASGNLVPVPAPSLKATESATTVDVSIAKEDLGVTDTFAFMIDTIANADQPGWSDEVPGGGIAWLYTLTKPAPPPPPVVVKPVIHKATAVPARAVAGKRLTVTFAVTSSADGTPLTTGTMVCDPKIGTKVLKHSESFKNGKARLSFVIPKTAKGKTVKVNLTIHAGDQSAKTVQSFRVR